MDGRLNGFMESWMDWFISAYTMARAVVSVFLHVPVCIMISCVSFASVCNLCVVNCPLLCFPLSWPQVIFFMSIDLICICSFRWLTTSHPHVVAYLENLAFCIHVLSVDEPLLVWYCLVSGAEVSLIEYVGMYVCRFSIWCWSQPYRVCRYVCV